MTARTAWTLERLPWLATRKARTSAHGTEDGEIFTLTSSSSRSVDVRRGRAVEVRCLAGVVLATYEGDPLDHILREGESFRVEGPGRLALSGLVPARTLLGRAG